MIIDKETKFELYNIKGGIKMKINNKYKIAKQEVIIVESEKSVMQAYEFGVYNILAIGCMLLFKPN